MAECGAATGTIRALAPLGTDINIVQTASNENIRRYWIEHGGRRDA
jgi:hypothetical protein